MSRQIWIPLYLISLLLFIGVSTSLAHDVEGHEMTEVEYAIRIISCAAIPLSFSLLWGKKDRAVTERIEMAVREANRMSDPTQLQKRDIE